MCKRMLLLPIFFSLVSIQAVAEDLPAIYLERVASVNKALARALKLEYDQCVSSKNTLLKIKKDMGEKSIAWQAALENYDREVIRNVEFSPFPEPDWAKLTPKRVEEFFDQEKYTSRIYTSRYRINKERCQLIEQKDLDLRIDNGKREFKIAFKDKKTIASTPGVFNPIHGDHYKSHKVKQRPSPRVSREKLLANNEELRSMPGALKRLADTATLEGNAVKPGEDELRLPGKDELRLLKDAFGYEHRDYKKPSPRKDIAPVDLGGNGDVIAGQACDMTRLNAAGGKLCVWHRMNRYPDEYGALVVLYKETGLGDQVLREEARAFKLKASIDPKVFELPPGVRVK